MIDLKIGEAQKRQNTAPRIVQERGPEHFPAKRKPDGTSEGLKNQGNMTSIFKALHDS
mgnify:CR=1 FL=1